VNPLERAVIEAAREVAAWSTSASLAEAVAALDQHNAEQAAASIKEIPWREVVVGDQLRANSGAFYPVTATLAIAGGKARITVALPAGPQQLMRPTPKAPRATVKRGPDGEAVDVFVSVFSSREG
jgi:hypothetical protein